jgi:putative ABC transport system permease protein
MLIILVASLNIVSSLLMTVMSRRKEIALLLSLGADRSEIRAIFFRLGAIIGGGGIIVGILLSAVALVLLSNFDIISLPADVYGSTKLPLELSIVDFCLITLGSLAIVFLSSYYPAKKASEVDALTVLRNE